MTATTMNPVLHVMLPGGEVARLVPKPRESIGRFIKRAGWPINEWATICVRIRGGETGPVMRADWRQRIRKGDQIVFLSRPRGGAGGTKNLIALLGMVAISALAPGIGTAIAGSLFAAGTTAYAVTAAVAGVAVAVGAGAAVQTLMRSSPGGQTDGTQDPIYGWGRGINSARPLQTVPSAYGRTKRTLDYATAPWNSFEGQSEYRHVVLSLGEGKHQVEQLLIDDTVLWSAADGVSPSFTGVSIAFHDPGATITDFPLNVQTSSEVSGQELQFGTWTGGFIVNSAGTTATQLALDFLMPQGLYALNDEGKMTIRALGYTAEYQPVDAAGAATGDWVPAFSPPTQALLLANPSPIRFSRLIEVPAGRYAVRARRTTVKLNDPKIQDQINWYGLRAVITGPQSFPAATITLRAKATNQLSNEALSQLSVISTRVLPVWTGTAWVDQPTRRPAWAALDMATNATYGGERPLSKVDLQGFVDLAALNDARDETFDYEFRDGQACLDVLDTILAPARARTRWLGDLLSLTREDWSPMPEMLLTDNEIVRDSLSLKYDLMPATGPDGVVLEYIDETTWKVATVTAPRGATPLRPDRRRVAGIVKRTNAQLICDHFWRTLNGRRVKVRFSTEHDGRLLAIGSSIAVQSSLPQRWGSAGEVARRSGNSLVLSPAPAWGTGQHYIKVRTRTGRQWGPVKCARGDSDMVAVLDGPDLAVVEAAQGPLDTALARATGAAGASYAVGLGTDWQARCLVIGGVPRGEQVALETWLDDPAIYDEDSTEVPPLPTGPVLSTPTVPAPVTGLSARIVANEIPRRLEATWNPASGAASYISAVSYDDGASWSPLPEVREAGFDVTIFPQDLLLRVAGANAAGRPGLYVQIPVIAPPLSADNVEIDLGNIAGDAYAALLRLRGDIDAMRSRHDALVRDVAVGFGAQTKATSVAVREANAAASAVTALSASVTTLGDQVTAIAESYTEVVATVGNLSAGGLWKVEAQAVEGGDVSTRLVIFMRASTGDAWTEVGTQWEAGFASGEPFSRISNYAGQFTIINPFTEAREPLFVADTDTSTVYMAAAWIKRLEADDITISGTLRGSTGTSGWDFTNDYIWIEAE
ncbi:host specificity factor TipJ family phage tail protein [Ancylobacter sp.]|uniref:host specificity factor TipJ family phage tail protein n=1 Tax=Ancylobacter sp. TaxID=1872567 RepID=UPI003D140557